MLKMMYRGAVCAGLVIAPIAGWAQTAGTLERVNFSLPDRVEDGSAAEETGVSSSVELAEAPSAAEGRGAGIPAAGEYRVRPFSQIAVAVKASSLGIGFDVATPLARDFNLRGSGVFFNYNDTFLEDGTNYVGTLALRSGQVDLDWFPIHGGFHISPGMLILKTNLAATLNVPGGDSFTLDDAQYTSSATDPIHGGGSLVFKRSVSPSLLFGFSNIIPRSGKHITVPFEFGAAYIGQSTVTLSFVGTACQTEPADQAGCQSVSTDPTTQQNVQLEQAKLNEDLKRFEAWPIISIGLAYKF
jgi:hypothetical protein